MTPTVSRRLLVLFSLPAMLQGFMQVPAQSILQGIYAKHVGLALVALGSAVLFIRLFDCVSDLAIGYLSDRTAQRSGSRKAWIVSGTIVTCTSIWFLFRPPQDASATYFGAWFLLANIGWSLVEIPYRSWSLELSRDYVQRGRIQMWVGIFTMFGLTLFYGIPALSKALGYSTSTEFDLDALAFAAIFSVAVLPVFNLLMVSFVPDALHGNESVATPASTAPMQRESFRDLWAAIIGNEPMIRFMLCFSLVTFLGGLPQGIYYLFMDNYLGLGKQMGAVMVSVLPASVLGVPFWGWIALRYQRHKVWAVSMLIAGVAFSMMGFVPPRASVTALATGAIYGVVMFCLMSTIVIAPALIGDISDYGLKKFGRNLSGTYMSFYTQVLKGLTALAAGLGLTLLGLAGFDATKSGAALDADAVLALKWLVCWVPAIGVLLTCAIIWRFPITREAQRAVAAELGSG